MIGADYYQVLPLQPQPTAVTKCAAVDSSESWLGIPSQLEPRPHPIISTQPLQAPFPLFGGKSRVAPLVWNRFGDVKNYVEPFLGSAAVLLGRPAEHVHTLETANDYDGLVANFWRAIQHDPEAVAQYADNPVNECDLHARHLWLLNHGLPGLPEKLMADPDFYDPKIAGWWAWGICVWIGSGFCSGQGPWQNVDGIFTNIRAERVVWKQCPHQGGGKGVNRKLPHQGGGKGVNRKLPHLGDHGKGVNRKLPHLGDHGKGVNKLLTTTTRLIMLTDWFQALANRLCEVRICCGDWSRVCGPSVTFKHGLTGVFLDPPYSAEAGRDNDLYRVENNSIAHEVRAWALANGDNPLMRIALCGYESEYPMPDNWLEVPWKTGGGYGSQGNGSGRANQHRERIWFSPHCLKQGQTRELAL